MYLCSYKLRISAILLLLILFATVELPNICAESSDLQSTAQTENTDEKDIVLTPPQEDSLPIAPSASRQNSASPSFLLLKLIGILLLVCALVYFAVKFIKKYSGITAEEDPFLKKVAFLPLAQGKSIQVITLLDNAYIIGVSENNVSLIEKVENKELVDAMNLAADENNPSQNADFSAMLGRLLPSLKKQKKENPSTSDFLTEQRDKLRQSKFGKYGAGEEDDRV
ncbi:flagellar biosynthetic protein FliO [Treponema phagedenis]|uniref:flagellar biosynthetic protein FliO n=1 Tax=Treponema phagedenis TaxID=162 RepID=UPI0001F63878|nr:flagellar biosynthetic protein FliO [Treponema phagedenis]EFW36737.1 hypothetical protein HMPREF9554_02853 [Treponema phagedenis F0421]TYT78959.1 flagellar biosynthetic protein FliO [Treponema phagedenis]